jgi:O-antigen/teichoic acid export membrane protein
MTARPPTVPSLRSSFVWTFAGNAFFAASQWALLSLLAKLGNPEMLGRYALAAAVATPVAMLSHLNLRAVLVTDVGRQHPFGDYLRVRLGTVLAGLLITAAAAMTSGVTAPAVLVGAALACDNASDIYYGLLQRRERMDQVARSMIACGALSVAAFGAALAATRTLVAALAALVLARLAVLFAYDRPKGASGERIECSGTASQLAILWTALPLGIVLMLVSLTANVPRYAIEHHLGMRPLGAFAAAASFITVGSTVVNALGQSVTPRLSRHFSAGKLRDFLRLAWKLSGIAVLLGALGVAGAALLGRLILRVLYRADYADFAGLLVAVMVAGTLGYVAVTLGYVITSARAFVSQAPLLAVVAATSGLASWVLVPVMGLSGAAAAIAAAGAVQIAGELLILRRALRRSRAGS